MKHYAYFYMELKIWKAKAEEVDVLDVPIAGVTHQLKEHAQGEQSWM